MKIVKAKTWKCGYCGTGDHARCRGAVRNQGAILLCACTCAPHQCVDCGNRESAEIRDWVCVERTACLDTLAARSAANPLMKELEQMRLLGGRARRAALRERTERQIRDAVATAVARGELDDSDSAAGLSAGPRATRPGRPCRCGCSATTKGGKFAPGHDMKLKGRLRREALDGATSVEAVRQLRELGWPVPEGASTAASPLALAS